MAVARCRPRKRSWFPGPRGLLLSTVFVSLTWLRPSTAVPASMSAYVAKREQAPPRSLHRPSSLRRTRKLAKIVARQHPKSSAKTKAAGPVPAPSLRGKVVVFPFKNDDGDQVSGQVAELLGARGLEIVTGLRPVDSAEQYRDMATHLGVVAYVHGDVRGHDTRTKAIIRVRSGFTGRRLAEASFTEARSNLPSELDEKLWTKIGRPMARACSDANKPRKRSRALHINAGTPIESTPAPNR